MLEKQVERYFINTKAFHWTLKYWNYVGPELTGKDAPNYGTQLYFCGRSLNEKVPNSPQRIKSYINLDQGRWYHFALSWEYDAEKTAWNADMYIDGQGSFGRLKRFGYNTRWGKNWDIRTPAEPIALLGGFDAAIDNIRISSKPRYRESFARPKMKPFSFDKDTLLIMNLDGSLKVKTAGGAPKAEAGEVKAAVKEVKKAVKEKKEAAKKEIF
jgi:hypothetical protein